MMERNMGDVSFARMPQTIDERAVLLERLRVVAQTTDAEQITVAGEAAVLVRLGARERYAVLFRHTLEILPRVKVTPVPNTPPFIAGAINSRGELLTVLNLKQFFRVQPPEFGADSAVLVVNAAGNTVGIMVDEILGEISIDTSRLDAALPSEGVSNVRYVRGVHAGSVTVLDVEALLSGDELLVDERSNR